MNKIKKELGRFLVAGFSAVGTDSLVYYVLIHFLSHTEAKTISFISGTIVAYVINKFWTFEQNRKSITEGTRFTILYLGTLVANVMVNKMGLRLNPDWILFSFLAATGTSTILNFIGMKWWVFREINE